MSRDGLKLGSGQIKTDGTSYGNFSDCLITVVALALDFSIASIMNDSIKQREQWKQYSKVNDDMFSKLINSWKSFSILD